MSKTPNQEPEDLEPITPDGNRTRGDDVGPLGTAPMSTSTDARRHKPSGPPTKRRQ